ncbi:2OG-Fe dioxygenase-domain-containing protein [Aspergillus avenaceus]|uniref:2OG-Fe dioxygenase-domain-containing protein n=1 Tax=Aspergillus avenaceus TaxID=36643 RepID=A0A5N6TVC2_ASPAV|nr:2OG-Fe dioxygenase-domain-containing protein [Aspergillus avenaceus]
MAIQHMSAETRTVIAELIRLREEFVKNRLIFVKGAQMIPILKVLGATDEGLEALKTTGNNLHGDPTLPYRKTRNGRFYYDFEQSKLRRLEFQPFTLSKEEDFVRHDSGQVRRFEEVDEELQENTALQALFAFKALIFHDVSFKQRPKLDYETENFISTLFSIRTVTNKDLVGEPALEGVHSDGVDFTMTTYLNSQNMTSDSAVTFIHDLREQNSLRWHEAKPEYLTGCHQHQDYLDTLLFVDHEKKHSLSPVHAINPDIPSTRDMLIFFTRKPVVEGHVSHPYDSLNPHLSLPLEIPIA